MSASLSKTTWIVLVCHVRTLKISKIADLAYNEGGNGLAQGAELVTETSYDNLRL